MTAPGSVSLEDKYTHTHGRVYMSAIQALVRLMLEQERLDERNGLRTAGFVSGYRGSPLAGLDLAFNRAAAHLARQRIRFQPGINEDLAATAIWGTQQLDTLPDAKQDGVFALWYGKAPGVDRSGDVLRHANAAGSARHGGVLLAAGDDPAARSTSTADQIELTFAGLAIPILAPASVQEILDLGLHGIAMSRFSGCWIALKCVSDVIESSASVMLDPDRVRPLTPTDFAMPPGGLNIRQPDSMLEAEARLKNHKLFAALAYARANGLNRITLDAPRARLGLAAAGKVYADLRQALGLLDIDEAAARALGLRVLKVDMPWPLEPEAVRRFASGLEEILVVEEKRALIEDQIKEQLYHWPPAERARVFGKRAGAGQWEQDRAHPADWLIPPTGELTAMIVARALASRLDRMFPNERFAARLERFAVAGSVEQTVAASRPPWFCSGCPHNTSTRVPEGSRATAGIGCHSLAVLMDRNTSVWTHMGGEGAPWIGQAPYCDTPHVFVNLGDGTYYHSGYLAIRAAIAARVPVTYKILFNGAVAMTGGQPHDGPLDVPSITRQLAAEGVARIAVVTDEPKKYARGADAATLAPGTPVHPRDALDRVQRELRDWSIANTAVSALIYDQTCATELRRRRKRGLAADPARYAYINTAVCEACGDCSVQSNCVSIEPVATAFGTKRRINLATCNKDFSCLNGFCPAFVTVEGGRPRRPDALEQPAEKWPPLPEPTAPALAAPYNILIAGIGGTGVVTLGALIGMAAHLEGKGVTVLDVTGLAQKGGAVLAHVRIAATQDAIAATRIGEGEADALIACDAVVACGAEARAKLRPGHTRAVVNGDVAPTAAFTLQRDAVPPVDALERALTALTGVDRISFVAAARLIASLVGDAAAVNTFLLGYAWQRGLVPVGLAALERSIELNGVAATANREAFHWGRRAAHDPACAERAMTARAGGPMVSGEPGDLAALIEHRAAHLSAYQDARYAARYRRLVARVEEATRRLGDTRLAEAVARNYAKLLAYKDEYEVARLYSQPDFRRAIESNFEGSYRLRYHFAPPLLSRARPDARPRKFGFGPWMARVLPLLARLRRLRGTPFDPFGYAAERRTERLLIAQYEQRIESMLPNLTAANLATAIETASLPDSIRGFGSVKHAAIAAAESRATTLTAAFAADGVAEVRR